MIDDMLVGRKAIIEFLRVPLDLSPNMRIAWNKVYRWRTQQGMDKVFHRDITGRPFIIKSEVIEWLMGTDGQRVRKAYPNKRDREIVPESGE